VCLDEAAAVSLVNSLKMKSNLRELDLGALTARLSGEVVEKIAELLDMKTLTRFSVNGITPLFHLGSFMYG